MKHSFIIYEALKGQPPKKIVRPIVDTAKNTIIFFAFFFIIRLCCAAHRDIRAMKKSQTDSSNCAASSLFTSMRHSAYKRENHEARVDMG